MNTTLKNLLIVLFVACGIGALYFSLANGMPHDTDPHQHYDLPDYYNGPMGPHGGNASAPKTTQKNSSME